MSNRMPVLLGVVALGLLLYIYVDLWEAPSSTEVRLDSDKLLTVYRDKIIRFELQTSKEKFVFEKQDGEWYMREPVQYPANENSVKRLLSEFYYTKRIATLSKEELKSVEAGLEAFGLKSPRIRLEVKTGDASQKISLGKSTAIESSIYALLERDGKRHVVVVPKKLDSYCELDVVLWRSRELFRYQLSDVERVNLRHRQIEIEIAKDSDTGEWKIRKPLEAEVDQAEMNKFLSEMRSMKVGGFLGATDGALTTLGLSSPELILQISSMGRGTSSLKVGSSADKEKKFYLARMAARPDVFMVSAENVNRIRSLLSDVRDRKLVSFEYVANVRKLFLQRKGMELKLNREPTGEWVYTDTGMNAETAVVDLFLGGLFKARADDFSSSLALPEGGTLVQIDLMSDPPMEERIKAEGIKDPEELAIEETLQFGVPEGGLVSLQSSRQPTVVQVGEDVLKDLPQSPWSWRSLAVLKNYDPIAKVKWSLEGEELTVARNVSGKWEIEGSSGELEAGLLQDQLRLLSTFKARRWLGPQIGKDFKDLLLKLEITWIHGEKQVLEFGKKLSDDSVACRTPGESMAFSIGLKHFETLRSRPLVLQAQPAR